MSSPADARSSVHTIRTVVWDLILYTAVEARITHAPSGTLEHIVTTCAENPELEKITLLPPTTFLCS